MSPKVGSKQFGYGKKGMSGAKKEAMKTGMPMKTMKKNAKGK